MFQGQATRLIAVQLPGGEPLGAKKSALDRGFQFFSQLRDQATKDDRKQQVTEIIYIEGADLRDADQKNLATVRFIAASLAPQSLGGHMVLIEPGR